MKKYVQSSLDLLSHIRFFSLSTLNPDANSVWSSTLFYIPKYNPLTLIWYSKLDTRHSKALCINPCVSGTIYSSQSMPDSSLDLVGSQFIGQARQIPDDQIKATYDYFFLKTYPDPVIRKQKARPISDYEGHAIRRFYELKIEAWWVYDSDAWRQHQDDQRMQVPLSELRSLPEGQ